MVHPTVPEMGLAAVGSISPSLFIELERCALRAAWSAARAPELLPGNPSRTLGTAIHRLLEGVDRGHVAGEAEIAAKFDALVAAADAAMQESWLERRFVPLATSVAGYAERRRLALATAAELSAGAAAAPAPAATGRRRRTGAEVRLSARGGKVAGRVDRIVEIGTGVVIQDTKTGSLWAS